MKAHFSPTPHGRSRLTAGLLAVALTAGCDIQDEPVRPAATDGIWPLVAREATGRDVPRGDHAPRSGIEYVEGYEAGQRRAATEQLPMLIVFRAGWCRWSCELTQGALADRGVVSLARRFVCVTADADRDAATCKDFGVSGFPTVVVIDVQGQERFRATGSAAAGGLATALRDVLDAPGDTERIAGDIDDVQQR
ncbi:MAG: thioredoxin family protein [Pirellulales bacterium]